MVARVIWVCSASPFTVWVTVQSVKRCRPWMAGNSEARIRALDARLTQIDPNRTAPGGEIDRTDFRFTAAEGAYFNLTVALSADGLPANDEAARVALASALTHNPALIEALIDASFAALDAAYGAASLTAAAPPTGGTVGGPVR